MKKLVMFCLAAGAFALLVGGTPVTAQTQANGKGVGLFAVNFCKPFIEMCPAGVPPLGVCVSIVTTCNNAVTSGNANLFDNCCEACFEGTELCGIDGSICTENFGCVP